MAKLLFQTDIVGHQIAEVLQTDWALIDGIDVCSTFVRLDTGVVFELPWYGGSPLMILPLDTPPDGLPPVEFAEVTSACVGAKIIDIVTSDYWPTVGLLLSTGYFLLCKDRSPWMFGPIVAKVGDFYDLGETQSAPFST
jgi:hypothetical protein